MKKIKYWEKNRNNLFREEQLPEYFDESLPPLAENRFDNYIKQELAKIGLDDDSHPHWFDCTDKSVTQLIKVTEHPYLIRFPYTSENYIPMNECFVTNSGKMIVLDALLKKLKAQGHKVEVSDGVPSLPNFSQSLQVLIFCKFLNMMSMLEDYMKMRNYKYQYFNGNHTIEHRTDAISKFSSDPEQFVFLLTARSGGLGINLTSADTVIFLTRDWVRYILVFFHVISISYLCRIRKWIFRHKIAVTALAKPGPF